ncbi:MAG: hypothetical protein COA97_00090 [Flavobacteriales bacterium]|nr:MAG: hypothetical protein COA97_00090 [Flavobacteriales bacterium]
MKPFYKCFLIILMLTPIFSFGQEEKMKEEKKETKKPKHEVRIIMENFFGKNNEAAPYDLIYSYVAFDALDNYNIYKNKFSYGLGYNYNMNHFGIRARFYYSSSSDSYIDLYAYEVESNHNQYKIGLGLVYQKHFEKLTFFVGADYLSFRMNAETITIYSTNIYKTESREVLEYKGYSIEPLLGIKCFVLNNFSISTELRLSFDKFTANRESIYVDFNNGFNNQNRSFDFEGHDNRIGPNGTISFNFHF